MFSDCTWLFGVLFTFHSIIHPSALIPLRARDFFFGIAWDLSLASFDNLKHRGWISRYGKGLSIQDVFIVRGPQACLLLVFFSVLLEPISIFHLMIPLDLLAYTGCDASVTDRCFFLLASLLFLFFLLLGTLV